MKDTNLDMLKVERKVPTLGGLKENSMVVKMDTPLGIIWVVRSVA